MIDKNIVISLKQKLDELVKAKGGSSDRICDMVYLARAIVDLEMIIADYERSHMVFIDSCLAETNCEPLLTSKDQELDVIKECQTCKFSVNDIGINKKCEECDCYNHWREKDGAQ